MMIAHFFTLITPFTHLCPSARIYPLLKPSDIIGNILDIYYRGSASWIKQKNSFNFIEAQEEE